MFAAGHGKAVEGGGNYGMVPKDGEHNFSPFTTGFNDDGSARDRRFPKSDEDFKCEIGLRFMHEILK